MNIEQEPIINKSNEIRKLIDINLVCKKGLSLYRFVNMNEQKFLKLTTRKLKKKLQHKKLNLQNKNNGEIKLSELKINEEYINKKDNIHKNDNKDYSMKYKFFLNGKRIRNNDLLSEFECSYEFQDKKIYVLVLKPHNSQRKVQEKVIFKKNFKIVNNNKNKELDLQIIIKESIRIFKKVREYLTDPVISKIFVLLTLIKIGNYYLLFFVFSVYFMCYLRDFVSACNIRVSSTMNLFNLDSSTTKLDNNNIIIDDSSNSNNNIFLKTFVSFINVLLSTVKIALIFILSIFYIDFEERID